MFSIFHQPGSKSGKHKHTNKVGEDLVCLNKLDMGATIEEIKDVHKERDLGETAPIIIEFDVCYNGAFMRSKHIPGHDASVGVGFLVDNTTDGKASIGVEIENKLCYRGAWLMSQGEDVSCPGGHEGCTATIRYSDLINEERIAYNLGRHLAEAHNVLTSHVCTDSDARVPNGIERAIQEINGRLFTLTKLKDPNQLGKSQP